MACPVHWQGALNAHYAHADQHDIVFLENGDVLLANDGGVFGHNSKFTTDRQDSTLPRGMPLPVIQM